MRTFRASILLLSYICFFLQACASSNVSNSSRSQSEYVENNAVNEASDERVYSEPYIRARILADMLYEAALAYEDNRLLLPAGDNAYDRYIEVLSIEPNNQVALQGINDIVDRYVQMANQAIRIGQFDNAKDFIDRAASIDPTKENIAQARSYLQNESAVKREYFELDPEGIETQSLDTLSQIGSIGEYVKNQDATFLITARTDAEGRWIYRIMREAVGGYRLRGNITLGAKPVIQVDVPNS